MKSSATTLLTIAVIRSGDLLALKVFMDESLKWSVEWLEVVKG